jgi:hypothetical protein
MKNLWIQRALGLATLASIGFAGTVLGLAGPLASAGVGGHAVAAATGAGFWEVLGCVACIAGFVVGAGTTLAGLAVFIAANPEIAILCMATCSSAT